MKITNLLLVSLLVPSLAVFTAGIDPAYARNGKSQTKAVKAKTIRGQKDLLGVLQAAYRSKSDKKFIPTFVKSARRINGVVLPKAALRRGNKAIATMYSEQLSARGVKCLKSMKTQVRSLSRTNHVIQCDKSTLVLVLHPHQDRDKPGDSAMDLGVVIVILTLVGMGVALTQTNNSKIVPGSLADNVLKATGGGGSAPPSGGGGGDGDDDDDGDDSGDGDSDGGDNGGDE